MGAMSESLLKEQDAISQALPLRRFNYAFAKRHGVILDHANGAGPVRLLHRSGLRLAALAEARRLAGVPLQCEELADDAFGQALARAYQSDSSESMQMVEGLGDTMDLASLAEMVPEAEDLMEQEDDAPIIRLINALLTEAIRESASDIHIETYEKRLSVRLRVDGVLREIVQPKRELPPCWYHASR
jgi:general secretion pathway protein E